MGNAPRRALRGLLSLLLVAPVGGGCASFCASDPVCRAKQQQQSQAAAQAAAQAEGDRVLAIGECQEAADRAAEEDWQATQAAFDQEDAKQQAEDDARFREWLAKQQQADEEAAEHAAAREAEDPGAAATDEEWALSRYRIHRAAGASMEEAASQALKETAVRCQRADGCGRSALAFVQGPAEIRARERESAEAGLRTWSRQNGLDYRRVFHGMRLTDAAACAFGEDDTDTCRSRLEERETTGRDKCLDE